MVESLSLPQWLNLIYLLPFHGQLPISHQILTVDFSPSLDQLQFVDLDFSFQNLAIRNSQYRRLFPYFTWKCGVYAFIIEMIHNAAFGRSQKAVSGQHSAKAGLGRAERWSLWKNKIFAVSKILKDDNIAMIGIVQPPVKFGLTKSSALRRLKARCARRTVGVRWNASLGFRDAPWKPLTTRSVVCDDCGWDARKPDLYPKQRFPVHSFDPHDNSRGLPVLRNEYAVLLRSLETVSDIPLKISSWIVVIVSPQSEVREVSTSRREQRRSFQSLRRRRKPDIHPLAIPIWAVLHTMAE